MSASDPKKDHPGAYITSDSTGLLPAVATAELAGRGGLDDEVQRIRGGGGAVVVVVEIGAAEATSIPPDLIVKVFVEGDPGAILHDVTATGLAVNFTPATVRFESRVVLTAPTGTALFPKKIVDPGPGT